MNVKSVLKYQVWDVQYMPVIYLGVLVAIQILCVVIANLTSGGARVSGNEAIAILMGFIGGLTMMREQFEFCSQNSASRKTIWSGVGLLAPILSVGFGLANLINLGIGKILSAITMEYRITPLISEIFEGYQGAGAVIANFFWTIAICMAVTLLGYLIGLAYYRLPKSLKVPAIIALVAFCVAGIPYLGYLDRVYFGEKITAFLSNTFLTIMGIKNQNPWIGILTFVITSGIFWLLGRLLIRKAQINN